LVPPRSMPMRIMNENRVMEAVVGSCEQAYPKLLQSSSPKDSSG
jgi:hypothetical protein